MCTKKKNSKICLVLVILVIIIIIIVHILSTLKFEEITY